MNELFRKGRAFVGGLWCCKHGQVECGCFHHKHALYRIPQVSHFYVWFTICCFYAEGYNQRFGNFVFSKTVYFLDTDIGQTTFTPPGCVSLTKITKPMICEFAHLVFSKNIVWRLLNKTKLNFDFSLGILQRPTPFWKVSWSFLILWYDLCRLEVESDRHTVFLSSDK